MKLLASYKIYGFTILMIIDILIFFIVTSSQSGYLTWNVCFEGAGAVVALHKNKAFAFFYKCNFVQLLVTHE